MSNVTIANLPPDASPLFRLAATIATQHARALHAGEPTDVCLTCGAEIVVGFVSCVPCDDAREAR